MEARKQRHYRELLSSRRQALMRSVSQGLHEQQEEQPRETGDAADEATRTDARDLASRLTGADTHRLLEIEEALVRLTRGGYGDCEDCEEPIDPERLELIPEARRCAPCQEAHEQDGARLPTM